MKRHSTRPDVVLTIGRGLNVLRMFKSCPAPLSNADLVARTGYSKAAVSRITTTYLQLGYLRRVPNSRSFALAFGPANVGQVFLAAQPLLQSCQPVMQSLADELDASVALATAHGPDMLYVGYCASRRVGTLRLGVGSVLPMSSTAIGHAFLWAQPEVRRRAMIKALRHPRGSTRSEFEISLVHSFAELDRTGTCAVASGADRQVFAVALPLALGRDRFTMGLSCGKAGLKLNFGAERRRIDPLLKDGAASIEAKFQNYDGPL